MNVKEFPIANKLNIILLMLKKKLKNKSLRVDGCIEISIELILIFIITPTSTHIYLLTMKYLKFYQENRRELSLVNWKILYNTSV